MSGKTNQSRNTVGLITSVVLHLLLIGMVINQAPPDYQFATSQVTPEQPVPSEEPAIDVRIMKLPVPPAKVSPPVSQPTPETPPPQPPPPIPEPQPQPVPVVPAHPKILPPTPTPTPPSPAAAPALPKPAPPKPAPVATPVAAPAPPTAAPVPRPADKPLTVATKTTPTPAQSPPKASPAAASTPLPLNIHRAAQAAPAGVPTLPLAPAPGPAGRPGSPAAAAAEPGAPGSSRLNGLTPYPYGFMPNGGGGLRGTLVGCANADAVRLSSAERNKCNERFGDSITSAPRLDPLSPAKRAIFDKSSASDAAWARYRDSGAAPPSPSLPDGIAHGPASSVVLDHPASDYPPK